jgi:hypothetical protein
VTYLLTLPRIYVSLTPVKMSKWKVTTEGYEQKKVISLNTSYDGLYPYRDISVRAQSSSDF